MTKKKKQSLATITAIALLVTGTFAWQAFDQIVRNESYGFDADQGARLHNDFNGTNADIYIENYATEEMGATVFTRVRIHEYMEIGSGAGALVDSDGDELDYDAKVAAGITVVRGDSQQTTKPNINDESTWDIYLHEGNNRSDEDISSYLTLNYGDVGNSNKGAKIYMPTFNKNFDDHSTELMGSLNNLDDRTWGDREAEVPYDLYREYTIGESMTGTAVYSTEDYIAQENGGETEFEETHIAQSTQEGYVISMEEWIALGVEATEDASGDAEAGDSEDEDESNKDNPQIGDYWVIDTDGWAYWANGLAPQTATSLLVDNITKVRVPDDRYHYALHVETQAATSYGWIEAAAGMNKGDISEDALDLMLISWKTDAAIYTITSIKMTQPLVSR